MIVVVSKSDDVHAQRVIAHLDAAGRESLLLDLSELPERATLTVDYDRGALELGRGGGESVDLDAATAVWWRRPQAVAPAGPMHPEVALYVANEWGEALNGLWQLLDASRWVNDPVRDEVAARKAHQLRVAADVGLRVPRTLITSDPARAAAFVEAEGAGATIFKSFSCTYAIWTETRIVGDGGIARLDDLRLAPAIFQERVPGVDVRATVIGGRIFAAAIDARTTDYPHDFRMSLGQAAVAPTELPADVQEMVHALMDRLGLAYGAIDMRRTDDGEHVFLELNTAGEFLFVEERTGQPIAQALAELLATPA